MGWANSTDTAQAVGKWERGRRGIATGCNGGGSAEEGDGLDDGHGGRQVVRASLDGRQTLVRQGALREGVACRRGLRLRWRSLTKDGMGNHGMESRQRRDCGSGSGAVTAGAIQCSAVDTDVQWLLISGLAA